MLPVDSHGNSTFPFPQPNPLPKERERLGPPIRGCLHRSQLGLWSPLLFPIKDGHRVEVLPFIPNFDLRCGAAYILQYSMRRLLLDGKK